MKRVSRDKLIKEVGVGGVFVKCAEKTEFSDFGFLLQTKTAPWGDEHSSPTIADFGIGQWHMRALIARVHDPSPEAQDIVVRTLQDKESAQWQRYVPRAQPEART